MNFLIYYIQRNYRNINIIVSTFIDIPNSAPSFATINCVKLGGKLDIIGN
jgi:hypothetical protein